MKRFISIILLTVATYVSVFPQNVSLTCGTTVIGSRVLEARDYVVLAPGFQFNPLLGLSTLTVRTNPAIICDADYTDTAYNPSVHSPDTLLPAGYVRGAGGVSATGGATYDIPLHIPTGTAGMEPSLSLTYDSQGGNGILGAGFTLSGLSAITLIHAPYYSRNEADVTQNPDKQFALDGNRLVLQSGTPGSEGAIYRTENETFSTITFHGTLGNGNDWFQVVTKDGMTMEYGRTTNSKIRGNGTTAVFHLNRITDKTGNYVEYSYGDLDGEKYLESVDYTGHEENGQTVLSPYNHIRFYYDRRTDANSLYTHGVEIRNTLIVRRIDVTVDDETVRRYDFGYFANGDGRITDLDRITETDARGNPLERIRIRFPNVSGIVNCSESHTLSGDLADKQNYFGDFNGDGYTDIFSIPHRASWTSNTVWKLYVNDGTYFNLIDQGYLSTSFDTAYVADYDCDGKDEIFWKLVFSPNNSMANFTAYGLEDNRLAVKHNVLGDKTMDLHYGDFNGDGAIEYMFSKENQRSVSFGGAMQNVNSDNLNQVLLLYPHSDVFVGDFNGNGINDIIIVCGISNKRRHVHVFEYDSNTDSFKILLQSYLIDESADKVAIGDFNGDGATDIVVADYQQDHSFYNRKIINTYVYYSTGKSFVMRAGPYTDTQYLNFYYPIVEWGPDFYVHDMDGDGKSDILFMNYGYTNEEGDMYAHSVSFSKGISFSDPRQIYGVYWSSFSNLIDMGYDGTKKRLVAIENNTISTFYQKNTANLVESITNNSGMTTMFSYAPLRDSTLYRKTESLAFPMQNAMVGGQFVRNISVYDRNSGDTLSSVDYTYSNLRFHRQGRGSLGFGGTTATDNITDERVSSTYSYDPVLFLPYLSNSENHIGNTLVSSTGYTMRFDRKDNNRRYLSYVSETESENMIDGTRTVSTQTLYPNGDIMNAVDTVFNQLSQIVRRSVFSGLSYNTYGQPLRTTTSVTYDGHTSMRTTVNEYSANRLTKTTEVYTGGTDVETSYTYDGYGNVIGKSVTDGIFTKNFSYVYEDGKKRFITRTTNDLGETTTYARSNATGLLLSETDHRGLMTSYGYDGAGRVVEICHPDGTRQTTTRGWSVNAQGIGEMYSETVRESGAPTSVTYYDAAGRALRSKTQSFNGTYLVSDTEYDRKGRVTFEYVPYFEGSGRDLHTSYAYDNLGRVSSVTSPSGNVTTYSYGPLSVSFTQAGRTYTSEYDAAGMRIRVTEPGGTIYYSYDADGNLIQISSPSGNTYMEYDIYGNRSRLVDIDAGTVDYVYNAFGQLLSKTDASGNVVRYGHDIKGRVTSENWNSGALVRYYTYDTNGMLSGVTSSDGSAVAYVYDNLFRTVAVSETADASNVFVRTYAYDDYGRLASQTTNSKITESYGYNSYGYNSTVSVNGTVVWSGGGQNRFGDMDVYSLRGGGETVTLSFDQYGYPSGIETRSNNTLIQDWEYGYNSATGNMSWRKGMASGGGQITETFAYDTQDRLVSYSVGSNDTYTVSYDVAGVGNITSKSDVGDYSYSQKVHAPSGVTDVVDVSLFGYDQTSTYTPFDKIGSLTRSGPVGEVTMLEWEYSPYDTRTVQRSYSGNLLRETKYYAFDGYEKIVTDTVAERYYIDTPSGRVAFAMVGVDTVALYYIHADVLGSFDVITDATGAVVERNSFDPWGRRRNPADWSYVNVPATPLLTGRGFTGHEHLEGFGLINANGRIYDPVLGMFLSPDPYIQAPETTQNFNRYSYCLNNPLKYTDPDGEFFFSGLLGPVGALIDAACWSSAINAGTQLFRIINEKQDKFNWSELGGAAIGGFVGGYMAFKAPSFTQSNLFKRYTTKALYAGLTGAVSAGASMYGADLFDNGKIDFSGEDYLKSMASAGLVSGGLSLAGSFYNYFTWDRYSDIEKVDILKSEFGKNIELNNDVYQDGEKVKAGRPLNETMTAKVGHRYISSEYLAYKSTARSIFIHETVHDRDIDIQIYKIIFGENDALSLDDFINQTEKNAYYQQLLHTSRNTPGWWWKQTAGYAKNYKAEIPKTYRVWQLIFNLF